MKNAPFVLATVLAASLAGPLLPAARADVINIDNAEVARLTAKGVPVTSDMRYGNVPDTLVAIAQEADAAQIIIGRTGQSTIVARLFGSVAGTLAQMSPVPVTIVP